MLVTIVHRSSHIIHKSLLISLLLMQGIFCNMAVAESPLPTASPHAAVMAPLATRSLLMDIGYQQGLAIAVGERGHILVACGDCSEWHQANVPVSATLTAVHMYDDQIAWAVGHDAVILKTIDGGENWQLQFRAPEQERPFLDVWFRDQQQGYAIGAYGLFMTTSDGGETWQEQLIGEDDFHLNQLSYSDRNGFYIAAEAGMIYHSADGEQWELLDSPYEGSFFDVQTLPDGSLLLVGLRGHAFRSEDGRSWKEVGTDTESLLTSIKVFSTGKVLITGMAGTLLLSDDGENFRVIQKADRKGLAAVAEMGDGRLLSVGEGGIRRLELD